MKKIHRSRNIIITVLLIITGVVTFLLIRSNKRKDQIVYFVSSESPRLFTKFSKEFKNAEAVYERIDSLKSRRQRLLFVLDKIPTDTFPAPEKIKRITIINDELYDINTELRRDLLAAACFHTISSQPVESYNGLLGHVSFDFCIKHAKHAGLLRWSYAFPDSLKLMYSDGLMKGQAIGSGVLIDTNLFLTAGHCIEFSADDTKIPKYNGYPVNTYQAAHLMSVVFNYELYGSTRLISSDTMSFPVDSVMDFRTGTRDFAILRLGKNKEGKWPGEKYGYETFTAGLPKNNEIAAIIEHPNADSFPFTKKISAGKLDMESTNPVCIYYYDLATEPGSSGSPIFSFVSDELVGIHLGGDCTSDAADGNQGITINAIVASSPFLQSRRAGKK